MSLLSLQNVGLKYDEFNLNDVSFRLNPGEKVSILGLSGSGKTSLLSLIYGLIDLTEGIIQFNQEPVLGPSKVLIPGHPKMRLVNQDFALDNYHTVQENISNKILHFEKNEIKLKTEEILEVINMGDYRNQIAATLSGGQKQRLSLGRALAELPDLLLLDEPFSQIDLMNKYKIEKSLSSYLDDNQIAAIMVTHDFQDAFSLADRILVMEGGQLKRDTNKVDLYQNPESHYEAMLTGGYNLVSLNGTRLNFRKNEFSLDLTEEYCHQLKIKEVNRIDLGAKYLIECETNNGETIVLESSFNLKELKSIYIKNKSYSFEA